MSKTKKRGVYKPKNLVFAVVPYTRIRNDVPDTPGSTPTKLKISVIELLLAPQIHLSSDIPLSWMEKIIKKFWGKPVYKRHRYNEGAIGEIPYARITDNPKFCYQPTKRGRDLWEGDSVVFYGMNGIIEIARKHEKVLLKMLHGINLEQMDLSIGYRYKLDIDDDDVVLDDDGWLNWNKTLAYFTDFDLDEVSVVDRGRGACPGARVYKKLSSDDRIGDYSGAFTRRAWSLFMKHTKNGTVLKNGADKVMQFIKMNAAQNGVAQNIKKFIKTVASRRTPEDVYEILKKQNTLSYDNNDILRRYMEEPQTQPEGQPDAQIKTTGNETTPEQPAETLIIKKTLESDDVEMKDDPAELSEGVKKELSTGNEDTQYDGWFNSTFKPRDENEKQQTLLKVAEMFLKNEFKANQEHLNKRNEEFPQWKDKYNNVMQKASGNTEFQVGGDSENSLKDIYTKRENVELSNQITDLLDFVKKANNDTPETGLPNEDATSNLSTETPPATKAAQKQTPEKKFHFQK